MKRKWKILFALLAVASLVLAAGCSDDSGDAWDGGSQDSANSGASSSPTEIAKGDVEELLQKIGNVTGYSKSDLCYWDFANGTLGTGDEGCTFTVSWFENTTSKTPSTSTTLSSLQGKGKVATSLLAIDLSEADWDEKPERESIGMPATTGTVKASIGLSEDASASHTIPESLKSVTIVLKSDNWQIN